MLDHSALYSRMFARRDEDTITVLRAQRVVLGLMDLLQSVRGIWRGPVYLPAYLSTRHWQQFFIAYRSGSSRAITRSGDGAG